MVRMLYSGKCCYKVSIKHYSKQQPTKFKFKKMVTDALLSMLVILTCIPAVFCASICVKPASPSSLYEVSENGGDIAKLVKQVSTEVTSEFMISILSSGVGHSALLCEQEDCDRMAADYHICVHQVQHQLRCGGHGGVFSGSRHLWTVGLDRLWDSAGHSKL